MGWGKPLSTIENWDRSQAYCCSSSDLWKRGFKLVANLFHLAFALELIAFHLVSPTSWVHHFVWMIYPLVALAFACLDRRQLAPIILFAISYAHIAFTLDYRSDQLFRWPQALWISTKFYGLIILYAVNAWLLLSAPHRAPAPAVPPTVASVS